MAFDAGMLACSAHEIRITALGGRVEKVMQPGRDELVLQIRSLTGGKRLLINAGTGPRIGFTDKVQENPAQPPMFCMLLRKHLTGSTLKSVDQAGFDRILTLRFDARDEMGFPCVRGLVAEIMGKYSNIILTDEDHGGKIIAALRTVDFSSSSVRQVLPGICYELPPSQNKENPLTVSEEAFSALLTDYTEEFPDRKLTRFITDRFSGISAAVAREIVYLATGNQDAPASSVSRSWPSLFQAFDGMMDRIRKHDYRPTMILDGNQPVEYAFCPLTQYPSPFESRPYETAAALMDDYFDSRDREARLHQRASDILHLLTRAESRIQKKLALQREELAGCAEADRIRKCGDLIIGNLYRLEKGMKQAELVDYENWNEETESYGTCSVELDERLSPSANAQKYYKKYEKARNASVELKKQIDIGEAELAYIYTVFDSLTHAETTADLDEIREELYHSGYASRMKNYRLPRKRPAPTVAQFRTSGGFRVLCGKNNLQNEYVTHKLADRNDYWFHAKGVPGSHVVLVTDGKEPSDRDLTEAACIAAHFSKSSGEAQIPVDYLLVRHVRKVAGAKPGFVIYHTNRTAYVTPDAEAVNGMRVK